MMKMVMIVFNISIQEEVYELLDSLKVTCFTQWPRLIGKGVSTGPKMDDGVWPGANSAIITVVQEDQAENIMTAVQDFRDNIGMHEGVKAFLMPVEKITGEI